MRADVRLDFVLVRDDSNYLIIRSITERSLLGREGPGGVELDTLSRIKMAYESGPVTP